MANSREKNFIDACYRAYKFDWMMERGINPEDIICEAVDIIKDMDGEVTADGVKDAFFYSGFHGDMYVCRDEFLGAEFRDAKYMSYLFTVMYYGDELARSEAEELWESITKLQMFPEG